MNTGVVAPRNVAPAPRCASAIACDLWSASHALLDLAGRITAGRAVATDLDALALGLQRCAAELRMGGADGRA